MEDEFCFLPRSRVVKTETDFGQIEKKINKLEKAKERKKSAEYGIFLTEKRLEIINAKRR